MKVALGSNLAVQWWSREWPLSATQQAFAARARIGVWYLQTNMETLAGWRSLEPQPSPQGLQGFRDSAPSRSSRLASPEARTYKVGACQALGEPRFPHFSTLSGGQLSASVSRLPASGGS